MFLYRAGRFYPSHMKDVPVCRRLSHRMKVEFHHRGDQDSRFRVLQLAKLGNLGSYYSTDLGLRTPDLGSVSLRAMVMRF